MKKIKIYLDTSVIGGCFDEEFKQYSIQLIDEIKNTIKLGIISDITIRELQYAPDIVQEHFREYSDLLQILETNDESRDLANEYVKEKIVTESSYDDAFHIAIATVNNIDILCSWNFKHIVNYNRIVQYNAINLRMGYKALAIYSPREVLENGE